jgi:uncharacterized repeat protein (TIGR01451 family)
MKLSHTYPNCWRIGFSLCLLVTLSATPTLGQRPVHRLYRSDMPPGAIGARQVAHGQDRWGYVQPVRIIVPDGAIVSVASDGDFPLVTTELRAGLLLGQAYRLKVSNIPRHEDQEVYPSVEIIDRLHPPAGSKDRFPIPIEITQDDLELALAGGMVVRTIYLENPAAAFPEREADQQRSFDVLPNEDPLHVADDLGRPMAILRLGSRVPIGSDFDAEFLFGSPPVEWTATNGEVLEHAEPRTDETVQSPIVSDDASWLAAATDPNCPCQNGASPESCYCGARGDNPDGRPPGVVGIWPEDEYICDGGDQQTRVVVPASKQVAGLDPEDTIVHYDTEAGRTVVTASNNVCIYAPRFAAVRKVIQASEDGLLLSMHELERRTPPLTDHGADRPTLIDQPLQPLRNDGLKGPLALRYRTGGIDLVGSLPVRELAQDFRAYEDLQVIRLGIHRSSEQAKLLEAARSAIAWTDYLAPEVMLDDQLAEVDVTAEKAEAVYRVDQGPPRLRVIKVASCGCALPGEEITFTLRFDNIGEQTISNVTVLDNLTTRLEYVAETAECSLPADFRTEDNQARSLALRWQIRAPLKPGDGGIIRFRCRVR